MKTILKLTAIVMFISFFTPCSNENEIEENIKKYLIIGATINKPNIVKLMGEITLGRSPLKSYSISIMPHKD